MRGSLPKAAPAEPAPPGVLGRRASSPVQVAGLLASVMILAIGAGVSGSWGLTDRSILVDQVITRGGTVAVSAQELYRSLSDADATVASAFLAGGPEPVAVRERYEQHLADATAALAAISRAGIGQAPVTTAVADLTAGVPIYAGLVETARAYHRQGLPLGAAYLRESSGLMRQHLLPAAQRIYHTVTDRREEARDTAARFPWFAIPLGVLTIAALVLAQLDLARRTLRLVNPGLAVATLAALISLLWLSISWATATDHLHTSWREGSVPVDLLVEARITALQARGDEALTLLAHGHGAPYETRYVALMDTLIGPDGDAGLLGRARAGAADPAIRGPVEDAVDQARAWRTAHQRLRDLDDGGEWKRAVEIATGPGPDGGPDREASTAYLVGRLDAALAAGITHGGARQAQAAEAAAATLSHVDLGVAGLTGLVVLAGGVGTWQRIREYA